MKVKAIKAMLESCEDSQEVILKSASGIEWEILTGDLLLSPVKYKKKAKMYLTVK